MKTLIPQAAAAETKGSGWLGPSAFAQETSEGRRANNEDFCGHYVLPDGSSALMVLADGMGGQSSGEVASQIAIRGLFETFQRRGGFERPQEQLAEAIQAAHLEIARRSARDPDKAGMGATIVCAVLHSDGLVVGHVGDSRAYQFRAGCVRRLTEDHLLVVEQQSVPENLSRRHPQGHVLAQALGHEDRVRPTISRFDLAPGDIIMLCCDGVSDYLTEPEMFDLFSQGGLAGAVKTLVSTSIAHGSQDNCSVVAALVP